MDRLQRALLSGTTQTIEHNTNKPFELPEKVLQFGEGNFLRAFIDWMIDRMNRIGEFNGRAVVVQPLPTGLIDTLNEQDGLYTLLLQGIENGKVVEDKEIISAISRGINPYSDWQSYLQTAENPDMELIVSNTTEAGIEFKAEEFPADACPATFPAKLTAWLYKRFTHFSGSSESGMIILPCELINYNGTKLKECIHEYAKLWKLGAEFKAWIDNANTFLSTLVDRIVPGYPRENIDTILQELGYTDNLVDTGEIFHLFVIEGAEAVQHRLPFAKAGLNVIFTDDMQPYRTRKVAILNGAHTGSVLGAFLGGVDTVGEMLNDPDFSVFLKKMLLEEIVPVLELPQEEKESYAEAILERFANPFIRHELLTISLNSVAKWKVRVLPSLKKYMFKTNKIPHRLAFSLAALIAFYHGETDSTGKYIGVRNKMNYTIKDGDDVIQFFQKTYKETDLFKVTEKILQNQDFWGEDLNKITGLCKTVAESLLSINSVGVRKSIKELL